MGAQLEYFISAIATPRATYRDCSQSACMSYFPKHVLVPLDGSPLADTALAHALTAFNCRVAVLTIVTSLDITMSEGGILDPDDQRCATARERTDQLIQRTKDRAAVVNRPIETVVETGEPAEMILEYIKNHDVDYVIMGDMAANSENQFIGC